MDHFISVKESSRIMNTFNKKSLCVALAASGVLGAAGVAQAVNVSADGLGQVLIYPYYTVNQDVNGNNFVTLMSVVNTTLSTKAVKVRFREGRASYEVLDFNLFLSPYDVWTGIITATGPVVSGAAPWSSGGGHLATTDNSCTIPQSNVPGSSWPPAGTDFRPANLESTDASIGRTSEGYIEIFEMATYADASVTATKAKHDSKGVPADCAGLQGLQTTTILTEQQPPNGGLFGNVSIYSPAGGGMFTQGATALANFSNQANYQNTAATGPTYGDATPPISNTIVGTNLYSTDWTGAVLGAGWAAVTSVLMANTATNDYALDKASKGQTTWIATFPTKFNYVRSGGGVTPAANRAPFTSAYVTLVGGCENFYGVVYNREEANPTILSSQDFSPQTPSGGPQLCWEAQSIGFGSSSPAGTAASNIFGSKNHNVITTPYVNGWATLGFNSVAAPAEHSLAAPAGATNVLNLLTGVATPGASVTYYGLPVIGFAAESNQNDAISIAGKTYLSTFGGTFTGHAVKKVQ